MCVWRTFRIKSKGKCLIRGEITDNFCKQAKIIKFYPLFECISLPWLYMFCLFHGQLMILQVRKLDCVGFITWIFVVFKPDRLAGVSWLDGKDMSVNSCYPDVHIACLTVNLSLQLLTTVNPHPKHLMCPSLCSLPPIFPDARRDCLIKPLEEHWLLTCPQGVPHGARGHKEGG